MLPGPRARACNRVISVVTPRDRRRGDLGDLQQARLKGQLTAAGGNRSPPPICGPPTCCPEFQGTFTAAAMSIVLAGIFGMLLGGGTPVASPRYPLVMRCNRRVLPGCAVLIMMIFAYFLYALYDVFPSAQLALARTWSPA